jgi:hypothetical protein
MARRWRNIYRPGSARYAQLRKAELERRATLARANAARAKKPEVRRRAKRKTAAVERALRQIATREDIRSQFAGDHRKAFNSLSLAKQDLFLAVVRLYPDGVPLPSELPDPFAGAGDDRNLLWWLLYSMQAGMRARRAA